MYKVKLVIHKPIPVKSFPYSYHTHPNISPHDHSFGCLGVDVASSGSIQELLMKSGSSEELGGVKGSRHWENMETLLELEEELHNLHSNTAATKNYIPERPSNAMVNDKFWNSDINTEDEESGIIVM